MNKNLKQISTPNSFGNNKVYSQAMLLEDKDIIFVSGQVGSNLEGKVEGSFAEQTLKVLKNLNAILEAAGSDKYNVIKTTCFLTDAANMVEFNKLYTEFFDGEVKPARSMMVVTALPMGAIVEIEAIACKK